MKNLPGTNGYQCVLGANLTPINLAFAFFISSLSALALLGFFELFHQKKKALALEMLSLSSVGTLFGTLTSFCALCTLPVLSLFGVSISLSWFTDFHLYFQIGSVVILLIVVVLLEKQIRGNCIVCKVKKKK